MPAPVRPQPDPQPENDGGSDHVTRRPATPAGRWHQVLAAVGLAATAVWVAVGRMAVAFGRWVRRTWPVVQAHLVAAARVMWAAARRASVATARWTRRNWPVVRRHTAHAARVTGAALRRASLATARWTQRNWPVVRRHTAHAARVTGAALRRGGIAFSGWTRRNWPVVRRQTAHAATVAAHGTVRIARTTGSASRATVGTAAAAARRRRHERERVRAVPLLTGQLNPLPRLITACVAAALFLALAMGPVALAGRTAVNIVSGAVDGATQPIDLPPMATQSVVYAADGSVLAVLHGDENRKPVPLDQISPALVNAVIDTEDADFWHHGGADAKSMVRALKANLTAGSIQQGGSTITQQLVKNTLLTSKQTVDRKIKEILLANRLEDQIGKRGVLERYLNTVYFGEGAYGVETAAETYFGIPASQVDPPKAALLAGLIQQPDGYDPIRNADAAGKRRREVLDLMVSHGHLSPADADAAAATPLPTQPVRPPEGRDYFTDAVKQQLLADTRLGATPDERAHALFSGGLQIHTTLDPRMQQAAVANVLAGIPPGDHHISAALAAVDPSDGSVRAVVGGPDFGASQFNAAMAGAGRQPGSSFKVFTLVTALEQGYSPNDNIDGNTPCSIPNPGGTPDPWQPDNFEGEAFGRLTLTDATAHSVNCAYARLALMVGLDKVADTAHQLGITNKLDIVPSMTLGTNVVTPLQMASAYATLAADGVYNQPHLLSEVDGRDGKPLFKFEPNPKRVMSEQVARMTTDVLRHVVSDGTGKAAAVAGHDIVGKTGTAENYQDAWFVGYSPQLATAVWMGDPSGEVPMRGVAGIDVTGGSFPARLWSAFMTQALGPLPAVPFPAPDPGQVPPGVVLVDGQPRGAGAPAGGGSGSTWCWTSCGKPGAPPPGFGGGATSGPAPAPAPAPGGRHGKHG